MTSLLSCFYRMKALKLFACACAVVLVMMQGAVAGTYRLVTAEFWPFTGEMLPGGGMLVVIAREALAAEGHDLEISYRPWARAMLEVKTGQFDGLLSAFYTEERAKHFLFSAPFNDTWMVLVAKAPQEVVSYQSFDDFAGSSVAIGRNWAYSDAFSTSSVFSRFLVNDEASGVKMLLAGRVDYFAVNFHQLLVNLKRMGHARSEFIFLDPAISLNRQHLAAPRSLPGSPELIEVFNRGLLKLENSGRLQEIKQQFSEQYFAAE